MRFKQIFCFSKIEGSIILFNKQINTACWRWNWMATEQRLNLCFLNKTKIFQYWLCWNTYLNIKLEKSCLMMSMSLVSFLYRSDLQFVNWFVLSSSSSKNLSAKLFLSGLHSCSFNPYQILRKKMKFSIRDFFSKCDQIRRKLRIWSHLLKKSLMENFIFCAVRGVSMLFLNICYGASYIAAFSC